MMLNPVPFVAVDVSKAMRDVASSDHVWRTPNPANAGKSGLSGRTGAQATAAYRNAGDGKAAPLWP